MLLVLTVLLGLLYPAVVWGIGRLGLAHQADGSLVQRNGVVVGSSLLGQNFTDPRHFHARPSASAYAGDTSGGTNLYASNADQQKNVAERRAAYRNENGGVDAPADALTASGSGLDPDISPANALAQVDRVAAATGLSRARVRSLVEAHVQDRVLGFLGEPRVDVLDLNLALDALTA
jgi:K+-transporting ATPase ATPase C chain